MKNDGQSVAKLAVVGHRGVRGLAPENTLAAIRKALEHGVDEIEVDIHITRDNIAVLCHNPWIRDQTGATFPVNRTDLATLQQHKPNLPTLAEAIKLIDQRVPLQMEVKWGEPTKPVITLLQKFLKDGWQAEDFLLGSKQQRILLELHRALPRIPMVVIEPYLSIRAVWRARQLNSRRLSMNQIGLWPGFIRAMQRRGYSLYAYTLNDPAKARRWQQHGLRGVITDRPDLFS